MMISRPKTTPPLHPKTRIQLQPTMNILTRHNLSCRPPNVESTSTALESLSTAPMEVNENDESQTPFNLTLEAEEAIADPPVVAAQAVDQGETPDTGIGMRRSNRKRKERDSFEDLSAELAACICGSSADPKSDSTAARNGVEMMIVMQNGIIWRASSGAGCMTIGCAMPVTPMEIGVTNVED
ncbi:hypothetical protein C8R45DRAFT_527425 [Mycena sanguinolenta]|nr:hypothetical protein C8R45DRAFT_527425 [Mycena sanguinolenta]